MRHDKREMIPSPVLFLSLACSFSPGARGHRPMRLLRKDRSSFAPRVDLGGRSATTDVGSSSLSSSFHHHHINQSDHLPIMMRLTVPLLACANNGLFFFFNMCKTLIRRRASKIGTLAWAPRSTCCRLRGPSMRPSSGPPRERTGAR